MISDRFFFGFDKYLYIYLKHTLRGFLSKYVYFLWYMHMCVNCRNEQYSNCFVAAYDEQVRVAFFGFEKKETTMGVLLGGLGLLRNGFHR